MRRGDGEDELRYFLFMFLDRQLTSWARHFVGFKNGTETPCGGILLYKFLHCFEYASKEILSARIYGDGLGSLLLLA